MPQKTEVDDLIDKIVMFCEALAGVPLFEYQRTFARRMVESLVIGDGAEITALWSRQSGKTQTVSVVIAGCMVILPKLAQMEPYRKLLEKFERGLMVGVFAPVESQADTLFTRIKDWFDSKDGQEMLSDAEIDDEVSGRGRRIALKSGSFCEKSTANPKAKIESKSYHFIVIDECQESHDFTVLKSIHPMMAFYNGTIVKTGTASTTKNNFYDAIKRNQRAMVKNPSASLDHFQFDWRVCAAENDNYRIFVQKEMDRLGEDSDEFQLSYALKWLLDRGMFLSETRFDELSDVSQEIITAYNETPVLVGIDPARTHDSTVVTVVWVDWDNPDSYGYHGHRVLNWLEIQGDAWEEQYFQIVDFLSNYNVWAIGVDAQGMGDAVAERLGLLMPHVEVHKISSEQTHQSKRWKHLTELMNRGMVVWPGHARARRLRKWKRFKQQMTDAEKDYKGKNMIVAAPDTSGAHDDYVDSLAIACVLTKDQMLPEAEMSHNFLVG